MLATLGVMLSAGITTVGMHYLANWQWLGALVFGVLIAATDPVSVIATFQEAGARGRLPLLVEAESLFNDGTAAVAFAMVLGLVQGHFPTPLQAVGQLLRMAGGGLLCGAVVAGATLLLVGIPRIIWWNGAYHGGRLRFLPDCRAISDVGSFGHPQRGTDVGQHWFAWKHSERGKEAVQDFWEYAAFVANSLVFLLIGMRVAMQDFRAVWVPAADRDPASHAGTRSRRVPLLRTLRGIRKTRARALPASSVLGRPARRSGSCARSGAARPKFPSGKRSSPSASQWWPFRSSRKA